MRNPRGGAAAAPLSPLIISLSPYLPVTTLSDKKVVELELIEEYVYAGEKRYRFKVRGTNVIVNVRADSVEEGIERAVEVLKKVGYLAT